MLYPRYVKMADGSKVRVESAVDHLALQGEQKPGESFEELHGAPPPHEDGPAVEVETHVSARKGARKK